MKVLVTGATGFLGRRLVHRLLSEGVDVRCLVRPSSDVQALAHPQESLPGTLECWPGNLARLDSCLRALEDCEVVFHLAAALRGGAATLFANNVINTRALLEAARRSRIRRLVLTSSLGVYGVSHLRSGAVLDERCPLDPEPPRRDPYAYSKIAQEKVAWDAYRTKGLPLVVVRPGVIYGPGRDCLSSRVGLRFGNVLVAMGGQQQVPYTFVDNCAAALMRAGLAPAVEGEAFNIVDDNPPTARELLRRYRRAVRPLWVLPVSHGAIRPLSRLCEWYHRWSRGQLPAVLTPYKSTAEWKALRYSNAKAKAQLGWQPTVAFAEGLERTFSWLRQHEITH